MARDIYFVHLFNDYSGSPRVLRDAIDALALDPDTIHVLTSSHEGFLDGIKARRVGVFYGRSNFKLGQLFLYVLSQITVFWVLLACLVKSWRKGRKSTVVINTMLPFGAGLAARLAASTVLYYVQESSIQPKILKKWLRLVIELCADHVIFVSEYLSIRERFQRPDQAVVYNGLRSDFIFESAIPREKKFRERTVMFAGSLKKFKGVVEFVELARRLPTFNFVAALNCTESQLEVFFQASDLPPNLTVLVRPKDLMALYKSSFVVVNLSLPELCVETFGLSLLEGMAFGCPAVAPPVGGPVEFVNESNGLLVDARETEIIAAYLTGLSEDEGRWTACSMAASSTAARFSANVYREAIRRYAAEKALF